LNFTVVPFPTIKIVAIDNRLLKFGSNHGMKKQSSSFNTAQGLLIGVIGQFEVGFRKK
jgi:hypothetical protein